MGELLRGVVLLVLVCAPVVAFIWFLQLKMAPRVEKHRRDQEEQQQALLRAREEAEAERKRLAYESDQKRKREKLAHLVSKAVVAAQELPRALKDADEALDRAETEFAEGAFAPFWDAVEVAVNSLIRFDQGLRFLSESSAKYKVDVTTIDYDSPPFDLGVFALPDAGTTTARMRAVVRNAQKSFQFAQIYEQRRTNQLLVGGFTSLGQALSELGDRLGASLDDLNERMADVAKANQENGEKLVNSVDAIRGQLETDSTARRAHEDELRELLRAQQLRKSN